MRDYPIVKKIRELIADLQNFSEPDLGDVSVAILGALPEWPIDDHGQQLDVENFYIYEINENDMLVSAGGDWQEPEMFWVYLKEGVLTYKKIAWDRTRTSLSNIDELEQMFAPTREDERDIEKEPIKIQRFEYEPVRLYNPQNRPVGLITNEEEFINVRTQIKDKKVEGYYVYWNGQKIMINSDGKIDIWPDGFFDELNKRLLKFLDF